MALVQYNYVARDEKNPHELLFYIIIVVIKSISLLRYQDIGTVAIYRQQN